MTQSPQPEKLNAKACCKERLRPGTVVVLCNLRTRVLGLGPFKWGKLGHHIGVIGDIYIYTHRV